MRVVCQQPNYLPWLGYFEQIARADALVYLDDVQWIRQGRQHRARIPSVFAAVEKNWLTVPIHGHGHREKPFRDMEIDRTQAWALHHWQSIAGLYATAPYFRTQVEPLLRPFLENSGRFRFLTDLCQASVGLFWGPLRLSATVWHSSHLPVAGKKTERLVELCQTLGAAEYYSALGASRYLETAKFQAAGMRVRWQHFRASAGPDPRRPCDYSILDWLALNEWPAIRARLGEERGSLPTGALTERGVEGIVGEMNGKMN